MRLGAIACAKMHSSMSHGPQFRQSLQWSAGQVCKNAVRVATPSADALVVGSHSFSGQGTFGSSQHSVAMDMHPTPKR